MTTTEHQIQLPSGTWSADPVHSEIGFALDYMAGTFRGTFSEFSAELAGGVLRGTAAVASVQVKDPNLEAHLQSPDFFDAERHPQLRFASRELELEGDRATVRGEVEIRGVTRPIELAGTITPPLTDPYGKERFGLRLEGELDRTAFGLDWNNPLPSGEPALSNRVSLVAELQLVGG
jgi:polyisoprenoid-binding protein YceI